MCVTFENQKTLKQLSSTTTVNMTFGDVGNFSRVWQYLNRTLETKKHSLAYFKLGSLSHT